MDMNLISQLLSSRRTEDRIRAVKQLSRLSDSESQPLLLRALRDASNYVAALAAEALGTGADDDAADIMAERFTYLCEEGLKRDPGCHIRAHLALALGRLDYRPATDLMRAGIRIVQIEAVGGVPFDTAAHLRANCAIALAQLHAPGAVRDIALLLFDRSGNATARARPDPAIKVEPRKAAAQALAYLADPCGLIPLAIVLTHPEDEEAEVLQECMQAVVELEDPRALELLRPYLTHSDPHLAAYAGLMVARTGESEAPALLCELAERLTGDPLRAVVIPLSTIRSEAAFAAVCSLAQEGREALRLAAIEALAGTWRVESRQLMQTLAASDGSKAIRAAAQSTLSE